MNPEAENQQRIKIHSFIKTLTPEEKMVLAESIAVPRDDKMQENLTLLIDLHGQRLQKVSEGMISLQKELGINEEDLEKMVRNQLAN